MKNALGAVQSVLVLGGSSEIGVAIASRLAGGRPARVVLAGRHQESLDAAASKVRSTGPVTVETAQFDAVATDSHDKIIDEIFDSSGDIDVVVMAFGVLGDQDRDEAGGDGAVRLAMTNYVGAVSSGLAVARRLKEQGHGTLVVLSSVAGERVRRANFIYGSSKAGLDGFAQGLGDSLTGSGARVLIIRPGFVHTQMTEGMKAAPMSTTADAVAEATAKAIVAGREMIWVPATLRPVFAGFRHLPRPVWRRMPV